MNDTAYAFQKEPDEKKMLVYGETAFSYYNNRNNITSGDHAEILKLEQRSHEVVCINLLFLILREWVNG